MYTSRTGLVLGFHGTDETIVQEVLNGKSDLKSKNNSYDWLGHGIYFWDNSPSRALEWATQLSKRKGSSITKPAVIGAIIDLGYCLDLLDYKNLGLVRKSYEMLEIMIPEKDLLTPSAEYFGKAIRFIPRPASVKKTISKSASGILIA